MPVVEWANFTRGVTAQVMVEYLSKVFKDKPYILAIAMEVKESIFFSVIEALERFDVIYSRHGKRKETVKTFQLCKCLCPQLQVAS